MVLRRYVMRYAILGAMLTGCGGAQPSECEVPVFGRIWADTRVACGAMTKNVELARETMRRFVDLAPEDFDRRFAGTRVTIYDSLDDATGHYDVTSGVSLTPDAGSLVHELCHLLDVQDLDLLSPWHYRWEEKRFRIASDVFHAIARPL
jgi:hypothetical protein